MDAAAGMLGNCLLIGAATGLRSQSGLAAIAWTAGRREPSSAVAALVACPGVRGVTPAVALRARPWGRRASAPALLARAGLRGVASAADLRARPWGRRASAPDLFARPWVRGVASAAAAGELVADKSPRVPSRLSAAGLGPRLVLGAVTAVLLARRSPAGPPPLLAAASGASAAFAAAHAGSRWRRAAVRRTGVDAVGAVTEDLAALALAWAACAGAAARG
jgi:uncharacterized membrane protein